MRIIGSDKPDFYRAAAVIREYLPDVLIMPECKIIVDDNRYYGLVTPNGGTVIYDHVIRDRTVCNPEFIFTVISSLFTFAPIINAFVEQDNVASKRVLEGVGFIKTGILRQEQSVDIYSMTAQEWQNNRIMRHFTKTTQNI